MGYVPSSYFWDDDDDDEPSNNEPITYQEDPNWLKILSVIMGILGVICAGIYMYAISI